MTASHTTNVDSTQPLVGLLIFARFDPLPVGGDAPNDRLSSRRGGIFLGFHVELPGVDGFVASGLQLLRRGAVVQRVAGNPGELVGRES